MSIDARTAEGRKLAPLRRLPDGTVTRSHITYLRMWRRLISPVEKALGWKWVSFDPGVCFAVGPDGHTASLSVDAINDLVMALQMRDQEIEQLRVAAEELADARDVVGQMWLTNGATLADGIKAKTALLERMAEREEP